MHIPLRKIFRDGYILVAFAHALFTGDLATQYNAYSWVYSIYIWNKNSSFAVKAK